MRKVSCFLICLLLAAAPYAAGGSEDPQISQLRREAQAKYIELAKQADAMLKQSITVPAPPSSSVSCGDEGKAEADSQSLSDFMETFNAPEGPLCAQMIEVQRQLQLMGADPDYTKEAALKSRLAQKALSLIKSYGQDIEKVPAIAMVAMKTATDVQLLGSDQAGNSRALMDAVSAMYEAAIEKLFKMLLEEHDYGTVDPILDAARASQLLSGASGVNTEKVLKRLQNALRFELTLNLNLDSGSGLLSHWHEQAVFEVTAVFDTNGVSEITGTGTGSLLSFAMDDTPEATVATSEFSVQAIFKDFDPCGASVDLLLTPFHPLSETLNVVSAEASTTADWPCLRYAWEVMLSDSMQEDGLYRFPLALHNLDANAVNETLSYNMPNNDVKLEVLLVHKPAQ